MGEREQLMAAPTQQEIAAPRELFQTKYGYFSNDSNAYVITRHDTPRPWINILCNGSYGLVISQNGGGFSWWENANLARLTSWSQDLLRDESGKFLYLHDDDSGQFWSAAHKPVMAPYDHYEVHHAIGSTTFIQRCNRIESRWMLVVPPNDPLEIWHVQLRNLDDRPRRISLFSYLEWCLGNGTDWHREFQKTFIETAFDERLKALIGRKRPLAMPSYISTGMNEWPISAFHWVDKPIASYEGDKAEFLGRYMPYNNPDALHKGRLSNTVGKWGDSIASLHVELKLEPGQSGDVVFLIGKYDSHEAVETMIHSWGSPEGVKKALKGVSQTWEPFLNRLRVETPDPAFNLLTNVWLKYQAICGRIWARTAFYQSSAAFGFRDQLQDSHIFMPLSPELAKRQILLHAAHQYRDGSVMHWWFPLTNAGPKSALSDPHLWLVYLTLNYLAETDDVNVLGQLAPYLDGEPATLFDHCRRSIELTLSRFSKRGLPLLGHGDWNDGLSAAGTKWRGESIWLGHFLYTILQRWVELLSRLKYEEPIKTKGVKTNSLGANIRRYKSRARRLKAAINKYGWDGKWYWYASCDDGLLIGSKTSDEGKIHLNAQTWSVISGTATPKRQRIAMASVEQLLNREYGPLLLTPAYTKPDAGIGYLSRYAPGVRENGGVYSHGATWAILAECIMGRGNMAYEMYSKICPLKRGMDPELYAGEPYVMPGNTEGPDSPWFGRAGWTWYTGSSAWLFKISTEWVLGVRPQRKGLRIDPCIPSKWGHFRIVRQFRGSSFQISVENPEHVCRGVKSIWLDGKLLREPLLPDLRDGQMHQVRVLLGSGAKRRS